MTLRQKLGVFSIGAIIATSFATVLLVHVVGTRKIEGWWQTRCHHFAEGLVPSLSRALADDDIVYLDYYVYGLQALTGLNIDRIEVHDTHGELLVAAPDLDDPRAARSGESTYSLAMPLAWSERPVGELRIAFLDTPVTDALREMNALLLGIAIVGALIAALVAGRIADRLLRPLTHLSEWVSKLGEDDDQSTELIRVDTSDEIGRISNALLESYQELRQRGEHNRQMVAELQQVTHRLSDELDVNAQLRSRLEAENRVLQAKVREHGTDMVVLGEDGDLQPVLEKARAAAQSKLTVLLSGESGTGKEVIAAYVHAASDRGDRPFVTVNCAALPDSLIESELFGHERGAFTGATGDKPGKFKLADGGTIFLDEIGELPLSMQPKLLRVLEARQIDRVGADRPIAVDVRVIAATNRDLAVEVEAGRFREDLYYRLNVMHIELPPLRERRRDLAVLAEAFLHEIAAEMGVTPPVLSPRALEALRAHQWPGNVRELRHVLAATVSQHPVAVLEPEDLPELRQGRRPKPAVTAITPTETFDDFIGRHERNLLEIELDGSATQKQVAQRLQVSEARLHRLLKKHGLLRR